MALKTVSLDGTNAVLKNFNKQVGIINKGAAKGLKIALLAVQETAIPLTPLDKNVLRPSSYTEIIKVSKTDIVGEIGYTAEYAPFVHENLENQHPIGQAKFLEEALRINQQRIVAEIDGAIAI